MAKKQVHKPLFIHSLFRSGSTYIYNVLRRLDTFECFQEAIHEIALQCKDTPRSLLALQGTGPEQESLRHPAMSAPYFQALYDHHSAWRHYINEQCIYAGAFGAHLEETIAYLTSIIEDCGRPAVFQECRTALRIGPLKDSLGGTHAAIIRNPHDQWWSMKAGPYFEAAMRIMVEADCPPIPIQKLCSRIDGLKRPEGSIYDQLGHYQTHRLPPEQSYLMFFTFWGLATLEAIRHADIIIDIDELSSSPEAQEKLAADFAAFGFTGLDFSDCRAPFAHFGADDLDFFSPLEDEAWSWFEKLGLNARETDALKMMRKSPSSETSLLSVEAVTARRLVITTEAREAALSALYRKEVGKRDDRIAELGALYDDRVAAISSMEALIAQRDARIEDLSAMVVTRDERVAKLGMLYDDRVAVISDMEATLAQREKNLDELRALCDERAIVISTLEAEIEKNSAKIIELSTLIQKHQDSLKNLSAENSALSAALAASQARDHAIEGEMSKLIAANYALEKQKADMEQKLAASEFERGENARARDKLLNALNAVHVSTSWRVTAPLRAIARFLLGRNVS